MARPDRLLDRTQTVKGHRLKLKFLGAAGTVTGSKYLLETGDRRVLIDCGLFQGLKELRLRNWDRFPVAPDKIDAVNIARSRSSGRSSRQGADNGRFAACWPRHRSRARGARCRERAEKRPGRAAEPQTKGCGPGRRPSRTVRPSATGWGAILADQTISDGSAWRKLVAICAAQGGMREPPRAPFTHEELATSAGRVAAIDNRVLARIAKLAGAPAAKEAGIELHTPLGSPVDAGQPVYTIHAGAQGELAYALDFVRSHPGAIQMEAEE